MIHSLINIKNAEVTKVIAGGGNGSILLIDFETRIEKYVIYIYCTWRLTLKINALSSSVDNLENPSSLSVVELKKLVGDTIIEISANELGDFSIFLKSGKRLDVFCDITSTDDSEENRENWTLCNINKNECYSYTHRFDFYKESYS
ncbi:MAG: hypothetical protein NXH86_00375 [Flavobacteriaceae bacterium]|uniref:hypothetical protein n=1 Tax=Flagellimonas TaxID=444459 RepID=UPI003BAC56E5|nr:hypothetical protein [Flavobacteriaceae bacterium]